MKLGLIPIIPMVEKMNDYSIWSKTFLVSADRFMAEALFNITEVYT